MEERLDDMEKEPNNGEKGGLRAVSVVFDEAVQYEWNRKNFALEGINSMIKGLADSDRGKVSDGYHTFDELYEIRKVYNAALFNEWSKTRQYDVHKSWKHNDGELCFGGGWFIVVAVLPGGQISNHYKAEDWKLFKVPAFEIAKYAFDGHTTADVIARLGDL